MPNYFWDKDQYKFISLEKIRNFEIIVGSTVRVIGWISDVETVEVGMFDSKEQAKTFLENLETFAYPKSK